MAKKPADPRYVYRFGNRQADGNGSLKPLLGGKGARLAEMSCIGLPVPPGFTITTDVCTSFHKGEGTYPNILNAQVEDGVAFIEKTIGSKFGDEDAAPLLVSVRPGARDSMPGLMDTILNLGLNDHTVLGLANATKSERFAWDCYRRFVQTYGEVVMGVQKGKDEDHEPFEVVIHGYKHETYHADIEDSKLTAADQQELVVRFKALIKQRTGKEFPQDLWKQLWGAAGAVFGSWMNDRAIIYRRKYNIPSEWGTAVNVQAMVYGNTGDRSGSGVACTRNPANGTKEFYGEFLFNAKGEDLFDGVRTPEPVVKLKNLLPDAFQELENIRKTIEIHFKDMQDFEFAIQDGKAFMLQTRNGPRTDVAAVQIAVDLALEGIISKEEAVKRVMDSGALTRSRIYIAASQKGASFRKLVGKGLPGSSGVVVGFLAFTETQVNRFVRSRKRVVFAAPEINPGTFRLVEKCAGVITFFGGVSSHAALWARGTGKPAVVGLGGNPVIRDRRLITDVGEIRAGGRVFLDGVLGEVRVEEEPECSSLGQAPCSDLYENFRRADAFITEWSSVKIEPTSS
jgi:pyruvate,orthophosphate dikinase